MITVDPFYVWTKLAKLYEVVSKQERDRMIAQLTLHNPNRVSYELEINSLYYHPYRIQRIILESMPRYVAVYDETNEAPISPKGVVGSFSINKMDIYNKELFSHLLLTLE